MRKIPLKINNYNEMKNIQLFAIFLTNLLLNLQFATAQNGENQFANFEPTVFPDRIMLSIPGDPATSRAVTWRTAFEVTISAGEIAILDPSPKFDDKIKIAAGSNSPWEEGSEVANIKQRTEIPEGAKTRYQAEDLEKYKKNFPEN